MALIDHDGFDDYSTAQMTPLARWTVKEDLVGGTCTIGAYGRNGSNGLQIDMLASKLARCFKTIGDQGNFLVRGFSLNVKQAPTVVSTPVFFWMQNGQIQGWIEVNTNLTLSVRKGFSSGLFDHNPNTGTLIGTTSFAISVNTEYAIGLEVLIATSGGSVDLFVNAVNRLSVPSANTNGTGTATWDGYGHGGFRSSGYAGFDCYYWIDDTYLCNGVDGTSLTPAQDEAFDGYLGDLIEQWIPPTADGFYDSDFTPDTGANLYSRLDEAVPDGDTSYAEAAAAGNKLSLQFVVPNTGGEILALTPTPTAIKTAAGTRKTQVFERISATDYTQDPSEDSLSQASYVTFPQHVLTQDPATGVKYVFGTKEFGLEIST